MRSRNSDGTFAEEDAEQKFIAMTRLDANGCWIWEGSTRGEYGKFRKRAAHRWSYEHFVGPIPPACDLHHECHVKLCVNPGHLEPLTRRDHLLHGHAANPTIVNSQKTHCLNGHEFTNQNTIIDRNGYRQCRVCDRRRKAEHRARKAQHGPFCECGKGRPIAAKGLCLACYKRERKRKSK